MINISPIWNDVKKINLKTINRNLFRARLRMVMAAQDKPLTELYELMGYTRTTMSRVFNSREERFPITYNFVFKFCQTFEISPIWLLSQDPSDMIPIEAHAMPGGIYCPL